MNTTSWTQREFRKLAAAGAALAGICLVAAPSALAQQTNAAANAADPFSTSTNNPPDTNAQSKAIEALHQKESELNAPKTNAPATAKTEPVEASDLVNWVELGVGGNFISGDKAQYERQSGLPGKTAFGGVQSFHFEEPVEKKGLFSIDGRGIFDNHDYDITLKLEHPDKGYVTGGFRQFREYYDGTGGYLPSNGAYFSLADKELSLDRGTAFFEAGLMMPDSAFLKLRYEHDYRSGDKDSTEWGTTTATGPGGALNAANPKLITPTYLHLDEKTDTISADFTKTIASTDFGIGAAYAWQSLNDSHVTLQQPGEGINSRILTQNEPSKTTIVSAHSFSDTRITEQWEFTTGFEYSSLHESLENGSRVDTPNASAGTTDTRFINLAGGENTEQYTMNLNLMYSPTENLYIVPAFRVSKEDYGGAATDNTLTSPGGVVTVNPVANAYSSSDDSQLDLAQSLDVRYTGVTNFVFYARGDWEENHSHLYEYQLLSPAFNLDQVWDQRLQKYTAGLNWYPQRNLNFAASYYHKIDDNEYDSGFPPQPATNYPGYIRQENFTTDGMDFRMTYRPISQLSFVSHYTFSYMTIDMLGGLEQPPVVATSQGESGKTVTHNLGETISWTPVNRLFVQVGGNYVLDKTKSPAEGLSNGAILESLNNYWTVNTLIGYGIDDKTDVQAGYSYYRSGDYTDNSATGLPYGAGGEETTVSASLGRQITSRMHATLRYSFTDYRDQLFGGNIDYKAHTIMASLKFRF